MSYYDALGRRGEAMHCGPEAGSRSMFVMRSAYSLPRHPRRVRGKKENANLTLT